MTKTTKGFLICGGDLKLKPKSVVETAMTRGLYIRKLMHFLKMLV